MRGNIRDGKLMIHSPPPHILFCEIVIDGGFVCFETGSCSVSWIGLDFSTYLKLNLNSISSCSHLQRCMLLFLVSVNNNG